MKGIILAGGKGTRLQPLTKITSKQLLPVYNQPMIYYPLQTLLKAGIREIMIIVAPENAGDYLNFLGSGRQFGAKFTFEVQDEPKGLPQAFEIADNFIDDDDVALILGDNIFSHDFSANVQSFKSGAKVFAKKVEDPERFGVVELDDSQKPLRIVEKPVEKISDYALVGFYIYDNRVVELAKSLKPSARGETEIVDLHNWYLNKGELEVEKIEGEWFDAGTFDSLLKASNFMASRR
ncbi:MAG: sugar phosphate nucleotidyltransferase [Candidatus Komeilibacteria bacterium]|nr:sugar phosphate nucleotidyltransferase [Candidatus Komeilibacteria bacterium]